MGRARLHVQRSGYARLRSSAGPTSGFGASSPPTTIRWRRPASSWRSKRATSTTRTQRPIRSSTSYRRLYDYDPSDLAVRTEHTDDSNPDWRVEKVSFSAAYRQRARTGASSSCRNGQPPYQTVVFFPGSGALTQRSSDRLDTRFFDWVLKSAGPSSIPFTRARSSGATRS